MTDTRKPLELKDHLNKLFRENHPEKALSAVSAIAKHTSADKQVRYMSTALEFIKKSSPTESVKIDKLLSQLNGKEEAGASNDYEHGVYDNLKASEDRLNILREQYKHNKVLTMLTRDAAREQYYTALRDYEVAKARWKNAQRAIYEYLEGAGAEVIAANPSVKRDWHNAVRALTSYKITLDNGKEIVTSIYDKPVAVCHSDNPSTAELGKVFSSDMCHYLFVKEKGEGHNKPGVYGGEYVCCYVDASGDIKVQRLLIKQDTNGTTINHHKNIGEFVASEVLNELMPTDDAATVFYLRAPKDPQGNDYEHEDVSGERVYIGSIFFPHFTDLYKDLFERNKISAIKKFYLQAALFMREYCAWQKNNIDQDRVLEQLLDYKLKPAQKRLFMLAVLGNSKLEQLLENIQKGEDIDLGLNEKEEDEQQRKEAVPAIYDFMQSWGGSLKERQGQDSVDALYKRFIDFRTEYERVIDEPPNERPKGLNVPYYEPKFTEIFNKNILVQKPEDNADDSNCTYDNYAPLTVGSLLIQDFDTHTANYGAVPIEAEDKAFIADSTRKRLKRIDFGAAFRDFDEELHIHSHSRHLPLLGPTNHIREWPLQLRENQTFINELKRQGNYYPYEKGHCSYESVCESIDRAMDKTEKIYGTPALEKFAKHIGGIGVGGIKLRAFFSRSGLSYHDRLRNAIRGHLKETMRWRQVSMQILALEFEMSRHAKLDGSGKMIQSDDLDKLIRQNPSYFLHANFHLRHTRNRKSSAYEKAMRVYAKTVLQQSDALNPILQKDFTCEDKPARAKILFMQLKLLAQFAEGEQKERLQEHAANLLHGWKKYYRERRHIFSRDRDKGLRFLVSLCDTSYRSFQHCYQELTKDPEKKALIDHAMHVGKTLDLSRASQAKEYCERLKGNLGKRPRIKKPANITKSRTGTITAASTEEAKAAAAIEKTEEPAKPVVAEEAAKAKAALPSSEPSSAIQKIPHAEISVAVQLDIYSKLSEKMNALSEKHNDLVKAMIMIWIGKLNEYGQSQIAKEALKRHSVFHPELVKKLQEEAASAQKQPTPPAA